MTGRDVKRDLKYAERMTRLYADDRFPNTPAGGEVRALAAALIWTWYTLPEGTPPAARARTVERATGLKWRAILYGPVRADAPRWEPPDDRYATLCPEPLKTGPRRGEPCNQRPYRSHRVTDPETGRWEYVGFCRRHEIEGEASAIAERVRREAGGIPEPAPNAGGLLPCHVRLSNWPDLYAAARPGWEPPRVGIVADDWPVLAKEVEAGPPRLVLVRGGGLGGGAPGAAPVIVGPGGYRRDPVPPLGMVPGIGPDDDGTDSDDEGGDPR